MDETSLLFLVVVSFLIRITKKEYIELRLFNGFDSKIFSLCFFKKLKPLTFERLFMPARLIIKYGSTFITIKGQALMLYIQQ